MDQAGFKKRLEMATNVAVLMAAIIVIATFSKKLFTPSAKIQLESGFKKGVTLAQLPGLDYGSSPKTLILALSSKCKVCSQNLPFYKRLAQLQRDGNRASRLVAIFSDPEDEVRDYIKQNSFDVHTVSGIDFSRLNVAATPTTILVGGEGKVLDFWIGKPSEDVEQQIIGAMS